jgi:hypothetical protein
MANLPDQSRLYLLTISANNFFLAGYGETDSGGCPHDFYRYNVNNNKWDTVINLNFIDSFSVGGSGFVFGKQVYFFGGLKNSTDPYRDMWTADASSLFPHSDTTGIATVQDQYRLNIQSSERGDISFYDELGQLAYTSHLDAGTTTINYDDIHRSSGILLYHATLRNGKTENGKVILY